MTTSKDDFLPPGWTSCVVKSANRVRWGPKQPYAFF